MTGVFLQVRLDSSRLPNKALLELGGGTVIEHAMCALRRVPASVHAIVTEESSLDLLLPRARRQGYELFVGPRDNVLERFVLAARHFHVQTVIRATGDNPAVSWELARQAVSEFIRRDADYFGYDGPPLGTGVEVVRTAALEKAVRETDSDYDREHVTPYIYRHPALFRSVRLSAPPAYCLPNARVTLDTADDYTRLCSVFDKICNQTPIPVLKLVKLLRQDHAGAIAGSADIDEYSSGA